MNLLHNRALVDQHLKQTIEELSASTVKEALTYSLLVGGKRLRPLLLLALLEDLGGDVKDGLDAACALECIHTYSLVHDDLPALDNDDLRRGKPTSHRVYGEDFAILAGDALLTFAFQLCSRSRFAQECVAVLASQSGANGMILGQEMDVKDQIESLEELLNCYELKTGCLFHASLEIAAIVSGTLELRLFASQLGRTLGIAFQIQDDLLEVTQSSDVIGKSIESDLLRDKKTILSFMSLKEAETMLDDTFNAIFNQLEQNGLTNQQLFNVIKTIDRRTM